MKILFLYLLCPTLIALGNADKTLIRFEPEVLQDDLSTLSVYLSVIEDTDRSKQLVYPEIVNISVKADAEYLVLEGEYQIIKNERFQVPTASLAWKANSFYFKDPVTSSYVEIDNYKNIQDIVLKRSSVGKTSSTGIFVENIDAHKLKDETTHAIKRLQQMPFLTKKMLPPWAEISFNSKMFLTVLSTNETFPASSQFRFIQKLESTDANGIKTIEITKMKMDDLPELFDSQTEPILDKVFAIRDKSRVHLVEIPPKSVLKPGKSVTLTASQLLNDTLDVIPKSYECTGSSTVEELSYEHSADVHVVRCSEPDLNNRKETELTFEGEFTISSSEVTIQNLHSDGQQLYQSVSGKFEPISSDTSVTIRPKMSSKTDPNPNKVFHIISLDKIKSILDILWIKTFDRACKKNTAANYKQLVLHYRKSNVVLPIEVRCSESVISLGENGVIKGTNGQEIEWKVSFTSPDLKYNTWTHTFFSDDEILTYDDWSNFGLRKVSTERKNEDNSAQPEAESKFVEVARLRSDIEAISLQLSNLCKPESDAVTNVIANARAFKIDMDYGNFKNPITGYFQCGSMELYIPQGLKIVRASSTVITRPLLYVAGHEAFVTYEEFQDSDNIQMNINEQDPVSHRFADSLWTYITPK